MTMNLAFEKATTFSVDPDSRTITGLCVPYGATAKAKGQTWAFSAGTLTFGDGPIPLLHTHQANHPVGKAINFEETAEGLVGTFKIARTVMGDEVLSMAEDQIMTGFSVGLDEGGKFSLKSGVQHAISAPLQEVSICALPAFAGARVTGVKASADLNERSSSMDNEDTPTEVEAPAVDFSGITDAIKAGFASLAADGPTLVSPVATFEVNEEPVYRFDGGKGQHEFSTDLFNGLKFNDSEALNRVHEFIAKAFAPRFDVDRADTTSLNPVQNRPDMYVDQKDYSLPFYNALHKGTLADSTPFTFPKFTSATGLTAAHVEGVEPALGTFVAGSQTVTPTAISGKVEITREVFDQGGNPQVSGLIWSKMVKSYLESLEASAVAVLDAASPTGITLTTAAVDAALVNELEAAIAGLQFIRGGNRFTYAGTHIDLYKRLAAAVDSTGRKLLPMINPTNSNGSAANLFGTLNVAGVVFAPAWSLGAAGAVAESSYLVDPADVHVWNTPPQKLEFQYRVAYVDLAVWGYVATAISDLTGVREIIYDPTA